MNASAGKVEDQILRILIARDLFGVCLVMSSGRQSLRITEEMVLIVAQGTNLCEMHLLNLACWSRLK